MRQVSLKLQTPRNNSAAQLIEALPLQSWIDRFFIGLPSLEGSPISLAFLPQLTAWRGKLLSGQAGKGHAVHAASFIRKRKLVLESDLLRDPTGLRLILAHELFHFVWVRLSNATRQSYRDLIAAELRRGARGELGESAAVAKSSVVAQRPFAPSARFTYYVCESFCDTAAWMYADVRDHATFVLAPRWRRKRADWFRELDSVRV
jgi:hypothetical protein